MTTKSEDKNSQISTLEDLIKRIKLDSKSWQYAWFRGEPSSETPLLPKLYRPKPDRGTYNENKLLQLFRMKAPTFASGFVPTRDATDQWLFLAQHFGLPTRLLDWAEGALIALFFALLEDEPVLWMLNPIELNNLSIDDKTETISGEFPLTWITPDPGKINIGHFNIRGAWELDKVGTKLPVAILPTNIHPRMSAQRSCFTIHGMKKDPLNILLGKEHLKKYQINPASIPELKKDIRGLGINHASVFPDLDGLARELSDMP